MSNMSVVLITALLRYLIERSLDLYNFWITGALNYCLSNTRFTVKQRYEFYVHINCLIQLRLDVINKVRFQTGFS